MCGLYHSANLPANQGATAPPTNRTKLYADEATERSTGETSITTVVINVLLIPSNAPERIAIGEKLHATPSNASIQKPFLFINISNV